MLGHVGRGEVLAISVGNSVRGVPELALIAFVAAFIGFGFNVAIALTVLGIAPILTNSYVGVRQVDRDVVEAARGMGMSEFEIITRIELPLAVPTIMTGVRTRAINIIATASIAPLAGVITLGDFVLARNVYGDDGVLAGAILIALLAVAVELGLAGVQRLLTPRGMRLAREPPQHRITPSTPRGLGVTRGGSGAEQRFTLARTLRCWPRLSSRSASPPAAATTTMTEMEAVTARPI